MAPVDIQWIKFITSTYFELADNVPRLYKKLYNSTNIYYFFYQITN